MTPVYFVPGLAAGNEIFRNIKLPEDRYAIHIIEWIIPFKNETIQDYAERMAAFVTQPNAILVGVSFGGVVAQEMSNFLTLKKLIIISSVKTKFELPNRLKFARKTRAYKLIPTRIVLSSGDLTKYAVGPRSRKRLGMYNQYLHVRNKKYLDWAIKNMVLWDCKTAREDVYHLHGNADVVFPIEKIKDAYICDGGTHIMILNKASWIIKMLIEIVEEKESL